MSDDNPAPPTSNTNSLLEDLRADDRVSMQHTAWLEERAATEIERLTRELAEEKKLSAAISRDCNAVALERNGHWSEIGRLRAALTRLTNGYKYPTEVCQIAREALSGEPNSASERHLSASEAASISEAFARSPRRVSDETSTAPASNEQHLAATQAQVISRQMRLITEQTEMIERLSRERDDIELLRREVVANEAIARRLENERDRLRAALELRNTALRLIKSGPPLRMANDAVASWAAFIASEALAAEPTADTKTCILGIESHHNCDCRAPDSAVETRDESARGRWEALTEVAAWVDSRVEAEVAHRPDVNIYKRTLANTWGQMQWKLAELLGGEAPKKPTADWTPHPDSAEKANEVQK